MDKIAEAIRKAGGDIAEGIFFGLVLAALIRGCA